MRMARRKGSPSRPDKQRSPLVEIAESGVKAELAQYQQRRKAFGLDRRLAELLWSPEAVRFESPSPIIRVPDSTGHLTERRVDENHWLRRQMAWQRKYGDGHMKDRASLQKEALAECKVMIYASCQKLMQQARSIDGNAEGEKFDKRKHLCEQEWQQLKEQLCDVGEQFLDQHWLHLHTKAVRDKIRDEYLPRVQDSAKLPDTFLKHYRFVRDHLGPICDAEVQKYVVAVEQVHDLWPKVKHLLDYSRVLPGEDSLYRGHDGRYWPPYKGCGRALRKLRVPLSAIEKLLVAWSLKPFE